MNWRAKVAGVWELPGTYAAIVRRSRPRREDLFCVYIRTQSIGGADSLEEAKKMAEEHLPELLLLSLVLAGEGQ
jgi:hypothetical protein